MLILPRFITFFRFCHFPFNHFSFHVTGKPFSFTTTKKEVLHFPFNAYRPYSPISTRTHLSTRRLTSLYVSYLSTWRRTSLDIASHFSWRGMHRTLSFKQCFIVLYTSLHCSVPNAGLPATQRRTSLYPAFIFIVGEALFFMALLPACMITTRRRRRRFLAPGSACCQWGCQHERRHANKKQKEKERKGRRKRTPIDQKSLKNAPVWRRKRRKKRRRKWRQWERWQQQRQQRKRGQQRRRTADSFSAGKR